MEELSHGLYPAISGKEVPQFPTYLDEVKNVLQNPPEKLLAVVNQDKMIVDVLRSMASSYNNCIAIGEAGTGRFSVLEYAAQLVTGKQQLDHQPFSTDVKPYLEEITKKPGLFSSRDYLFLPNLQNPMHVKGITYTETDRLQDDVFVVSSFCTQLVDFVNSFIRREDAPPILNPLKHPTMDPKPEQKYRSQEEFVRDMQFKIHEFFVDVYTDVKEIMDKAFDDPRSRKPIAVVNFTTPQDQGEGQYAYNVTWEFLKDQKVRIATNKKAFLDAAGYDGKKNPKQIDLQKRLAKKMKESYGPKLEQLIKEVVGDQVVDLPHDKRHAVFASYFSDYVKKNLDPIKEEYGNNFVANQSAVLNLLLMRGPTKDLSIDNFVNNVENIRNAHRVGTSAEVQTWLDSVVSHIRENRHTYSANIVAKMKEYQLAKKRKEKQEAKEEEPEQEEPPEDGAYKYSLRILHGSFPLALDNIFRPHVVKGGVGKSYNVVNNFAGKSIFGNFIDHDSRIPPHMTLQTAGDFFASDVIIFRDSFNKFIDIICRDSDEREKDENMRTQFFEYLKSGKMQFVNSGISYSLDKPGIILACDIEDPLYTRVEGGVRDEHEIRSRMNIVVGDSYVKNTSDARKGTLQFFLNSVRDFNVTHKSNITLTPEAAHMLLMDMTSDDPALLLLGYGEMSAALDNICLEALAAKTAITPDLLKTRFRRDIDPSFFSAIDSQEGFAGYFDLPDRIVGRVNGLALCGESNGAVLFPIQSYFIPLLDPLRDREARFELMEMKAGLALQSTMKGFERVSLFMNRYLANVSESLHKDELMKWKVSSECYEDYDEVDGPSASLALTSSVLSVLSDTPIYQNRFVTGTLGPDGNVGMIGGTYWKAMVPLRIRELARKRQMDKPTYFIFPAGNLLDLSKELAYDPFNLDENVCLLPVSTIAQAFHYFTVEKITEDEVAHAQERGSKKLEEILTTIPTNIKEKKLIINKW